MRRMRNSLGLSAVLLVTLGATAQSKITVERDGQCNPTSWNGNTVECNAWAHTTAQDGKRVVWMLACAQQKNNTNDCARLVAGTYTFDILKKDSICDPSNASECIKRDRILMKLHAKPKDAVYTAVESVLQ
jgi:hypothetical protein